MNAFIDNEAIRPELNPGECRLTKKDLEIPNPVSGTKPFSLLENTDGHYYFHWMLRSLDELEQFRNEYEKIKQSIFPRLASLIKGKVDASSSVSSNSQQ